jgi:hypothetical protein
MAHTLPVTSAKALPQTPDHTIIAILEGVKLTCRRNQQNKYNEIQSTINNFLSAGSGATAYQEAGNLDVAISSRKLSTKQKVRPRRTNVI